VFVLEYTSDNVGLVKLVMLISLYDLQRDWELWFADLHMFFLYWVHLHYILFQEGSLISFKFTSFYYFFLRNVK